MKIIKIVLLLLTFIFTNCCQAQEQEVYRKQHILTMQFGGQCIVSYHYEYEFISRKYFNLNSDFGLGLNEHADDTDPDDTPVTAIYSGVNCVIGPKLFGLELGLLPTTYFYRGISFMNINAWLGIHCQVRSSGFHVGLGYVPRLYYTYSDPNESYFNIPFGIKLGFNLFARRQPTGP